MANRNIPSASAPAVDQRGFFTQQWVRFFAGLIASPKAFEQIVPTGSPFSYEASDAGHVLITGGVVSSVKIQRGQVIVTVPTGFVPVSQGDAVIVTYTGAPTIAFIPG